jgi:hypothetical protein
MENLGLDGMKILIWIFKKWDGGAWTGLVWVRIRTGCEGSIEPSGSIQCGEILDYLRTC